MPPTAPPSPDNSPERENASPNRPHPLLAAAFVATAVAFVALLAFGLFSPSYKSISYDQFLQLVEKGQIAKMTIIGNDKVQGEVRKPDDESLKPLKLNSGRFSVILPPSNNRTPLIDEVIAKDTEANKDAFRKGEAEPVKVTPQEDQGQWVTPLMWGVVPALLMLGLFFFVIWPRLRESMGGNVFSNYVRSPARRYERVKNRTTFEDVAGMDGAKSELKEIVDFLKSPEKFHRLGAQVPKGVLLVGAPGTGKTLVARAVAGEAGVPFFSITGSEFIQMFVGVGASRVRDLFKTAKENAPCLIFIDEIDAVGRMRGAGVGGGSDEREQTLNQILSEMDGFQPNETIIVLAATNRPDVLDSALLRPGRFDRHVTIDRPTWQGRLAILKVHTRNKPLGDDVDLEKIARAMIGMSGADLRNLCNEAALFAARDNHHRIEQAYFDRAADRIRMGPAREELLSEEEKRRTAYHEAGHALCAWMEPQADPILRVSILPRGRAGGMTLFQPDEDKIDLGVNEMMAKLVVAMGGRAADRLIYGEPRAGAMQDLKQATRLARLMVTQFGMSDRLGPVSYRIGEEHVFLGKEIVEPRDFSDGTAQLIDQEVQRILREADQRAYDLINRNRQALEKIVQSLLQNEELSKEQLDALLGEKSPQTQSRPAVEAAV
jgi:cell division protease FtsH